MALFDKQMERRVDTFQEEQKQRKENDLGHKKPKQRWYLDEEVEEKNKESERIRNLQVRIYEV